MAYRLEVDIAYNVRARKGERRAADGTGRMVKASFYRGENRAECVAEAKADAARRAADSPGYTEIVAVRGYDADAFARDPLHAVADVTAL